MPHEASPALLRAALAAAARGWPVFPLRPQAKRPALHGERACPRAGQCAAGHRKWEQRATTDPDRIRVAWACGPFNVGIATGPAGLVVVDLDVSKDRRDPPDGAASFLALCERAGQPVPATYRVRTPSGGTHLYFTSPPGTRLTNSAGTLAPLVDTRAWGGYVVAAGSLRGGTAYQATSPAPVTPLPSWLLSALRPVPEPSTAPTIAPPRNATRRAQVAFEREQAAITAAPVGARERTLFIAARAMGRFIAWGDLTRHQVEEAFQAAGEAAGLKPYECRSTLRSALDWSIRNARPREAA
ncbi:bifunctional DNA primase/polymerase [Streptomyces sp. WMMC500]|uniref:bifunctional DNA primase/polymerase n=1 Tax=Streptomyces sp. WMMC500 TaxID=3015154 RepID=UPI00248C038E|nr:bifunctional DNA primase/polymerase [Streptomyces sp. WMMC500]WBB58471.1 bifunctional DNA primase/polymerase [Streptomyces sp. WMMC500]